MTRPGRFVWILILVAALMPRLALVALVGTGSPPEAYEYESLVRNLLAGKGYVYHHLGTDYLSFHSSLPYVLLTAVVYTLTNYSQTAMLLVQSLAGTALALVTGVLGRRVGGPAVGVLAGLLVALHPGLVYYDTHKLHPLSLDALLIAGTTLALCEAMTTPSVARWTVAGLLAGGAILERGSLIPLLVGSLVGVFLVVRDRVEAAKGAVVLLVCAGVVVGPWVYRNFARHGTPLLMTVTGEHLWRGNNPKATGSSLTRDGVPMVEAAGEEFLERLRRLDEAGQMRLFTEAAVRYVREHPWQFVANSAKRLAYFAWFSPTTGLLYPPSFFWLYQLYYVAMVIAAAVGVRHVIRGMGGGGPPAWIPLLLLAGAWLSVALTHSVFYVEVRHRWGVEGLMLVMSAAGIVSLLARHPGRGGWLVVPAARDALGRASR